MLLANHNTNQEIAYCPTMFQPIRELHFERCKATKLEIVYLANHKAALQILWFLITIENKS